ncbi:RNA polymerase II-associated protein 1 isoform X1 [Stegostoma tigrinum]|uniref:RNA polymerase II-associated protein 1 isoform X1 n=1 Tax=Stegostoma tigrinum TaxID=3053191 RepID=UPI00202AD818|nr:RNA polymerase II-associated protein 1 isoform X1 [Stegostoma tigrinum]XP_048394301.1 RNA polymerase II-associated protein 1 isoform X1 [Stegostoma tigrinum]XP_048394302.1 RNA polymerase II-associated protein 1 isoform X1 [Stegostoma tigrinum]
MLGRPKPGESEDDLLLFQQQFLTAGTSPAAKVVNKRKVQSQNADRIPVNAVPRDTVTLEGLPDLPPSLMPAPPKKSKAGAVKFQGDDSEEQMDLQDQHITAVLSKIIERDTRASPISLPVSTGLPFPKVFHRSEVQSEVKLVSGKKSIFAQKLAAKKAAEATRSVPSFRGFSAWTEVSQEQRSAPPQVTEVSEKEQSTDGGSGERLGGELSPQESQKIHEENVARLQAMPKEEIVEERNNLLAWLDPSLVAFLKSRKSGVSCSEGAKDKMESCKTEKTHEEDQIHSHLMRQSGASPTEEEPMDQKPTEDDIPLKPEKGWVHMDVPEYEKLKWMKDLPKPRRRKTNEEMQARFSFHGDLIPPGVDLPLHLGLHHHGEQPEQAGYSLQELFHLARSQVIQQRTLALQTLARIIQKAKAGDFSSLLKYSILRMLLDAGLLFLLRFSLDDSVENVIAACVQALKALLVSPFDEEYLDRTFCWYLGASVFPLRPNEAEEDDEDEEEEEPKSKENENSKSKEDKKADPDVARADAVKGLLKMKVLHRLRYILEVVRPISSVTLDILEILTRIARHSSEACNEILRCPRLLDTIVSEFLPSTWKIQTPRTGEPMTSTHGVPIAAAMKLTRVLACAGRNMSAVLLNKHNMKERIGRFVAEDPCDLPLERKGAFALSIEALRLWAVAANYGQACDLYKDLYPALMKMLQTQPKLTSQPMEDSLLYGFYMQRAEVLICLLINITNSAGCTAELQAQVISSSRDQVGHIPPPPLDWSHVAGIKPFLEACVKGCLKEVNCPATWSKVRQLTATYIIYLGTYYSKLIQQPSYRPVDCLEELEQFCSATLFPFLSLPVLESMFEDLRSHSALCNPRSCHPGPETVHSLVSLGFAGRESPLSLLGSTSPFAFLTAMLYLLNTISSVHKGLTEKCSSVLHSKGLRDYLVHSCRGSPPIHHRSAWLLRHEFHFQYFVLQLASKAITISPQVTRQTPLYHYVAVALLSQLLPGSEHLAHELLSKLTFNQDMIPEGKSGGPEAEDLSCILQLRADGDAAEQVHCNPTRGTLLGAAFKQLPTIRAHYLDHFTHVQPAVSRSKTFYTGQNHLVQSVLLPDMTGTLLPADWAFLPLINLYDQVNREEMKGKTVESLAANLVDMVTSCLQWALLLEAWRGELLQGLPLAAKLARLVCVFLTGSNLFLEPGIHDYMTALLLIYCQCKKMDFLDLSAPLPGLTSFQDLYVRLLEQFESVSFGDQLFGCFLLLPLQRRFSTQLRQAVFVEHVSVLRTLGVQLKQLPIPLENYTHPAETCLDLLRQYFKTLVTGTLRLSWCPVLYVVAVAHVNNFIFSQEAVDEVFDAARKSMLRKSYLLTDEALRRHLLHFKLPNVESPCGFDMYEQLPLMRRRWMQKVLGDLIAPEVRLEAQ